MSIISEKAQAVLDDMNRGQDSAQIPADAGAAGGAILTSIVGIISSLLANMQLCGKTAAQAQQMMARPDAGQKRRLNRQVKRQVRQAGLHDAVQQSVLHVAATVKVSEVRAMFAEVKDAAQDSHDVRLEAVGEE